MSQGQFHSVTIVLETMVSRHYDTNSCIEKKSFMFFLVLQCLHSGSQKNAAFNIIMIIIVFAPKSFFIVFYKWLCNCKIMKVARGWYTLVLGNINALVILTPHLHTSDESCTQNWILQYPESAKKKGLRFFFIFCHIWLFFKVSQHLWHAPL